MSKTKILFLDDEILLVEPIFDRLDFEFEDKVTYFHAKDCSEALTILKANEDIEILVVDGMIPPGENKTFIDFQAKFSFSTGNIFANYISTQYPRINIIAFTVMNDLDVIKKFENSGAYFICKIGYDSFNELFDVINFVIQNKKLPKKKPEIFIVHGHNHLLKYELKNYLQNNLKLNEPKILDEQPSQGRTVIEKFEYYAESINLVFVLLTPDDLVKVSDSEDYLQPRPNVLFELGYFYGKLNRQSVILISTNKIKLPTDISGIIYFDATNGINSIGEKIRIEIQKWI